MFVVYSEKQIVRFHREHLPTLSASFSFKISPVPNV